ncbi:hypothetical protein PQX77_017919 [Marasmius sp. AFHP31]|nr:hypothetical protein PQX77_017919 [Marasmius sp. AFHP31]
MQIFVNDTASLAGSVTSLPAYTRRENPPPRPLTKHITQLLVNPNDKNSRPWITLTLFSGARETKALPVYIEGEKITGSVDMNVEEGGSNIQTVKVIVRGELLTGSETDDGMIFLDTSQTLWSKDTGKRLSGHQQWSFSVSLPKTVSIGNGEGTQFPLPPTVVERFTRASVRYDLIIHVVRRMFRYDSSLSSTFVYIPATRPSPPSNLRQLSYQELNPLFGPESDPDGWTTLPPVEIHGTLFNTRQTEVICHLSLAKPLCYARGSVIPLSLLLLSRDSQALDLFSNREAIDVRLRRHINSRHDVMRTEVTHLMKMLPKVNNKPSEDSAVAVWWLSPEGCREIEGDDGWITRRMNGEINLPKSLKPTCEIAHFSINYAVALFPFDTTGFQPSSHNNVNTNNLEPLLERRVGIATMFPKGPRPVSYAPPHATGCRRHANRNSSLRPASSHTRGPDFMSLSYAYDF